MSTRTVMVRIKGDVSDLNRALLTGGKNLEQFANGLETSNDRAHWLVQGLTAVVPAIVPIGAQAIPILAGLTAELGFGAAAAGTALLAFHGMGDALKAFNDYSAEPTTANLEKLNEAMSKLGPQGQAFVKQLADIEPRLKTLKVAAENGLLPGASEGLDDLMTQLPRVRSLISEVSKAAGENLKDLGANLDSGKTQEFFDYLQREAGPMVMALGKTLGNVAQGFMQLFIAFEPSERAFSQGLLEMSRNFNNWASGLDKTQGFKDFLDYLHQTGPQVLDTVRDLANMLLQVAEAAAPLGGPALAAIRGISNAVAALADSPLGPVAIGLISVTSALSRLLAVREIFSRQGAKGGVGSLLGSKPADLKSELGMLTALPGAYRAVSAAEAEVTAARRAETLATREYISTLRFVNTAQAKGITPSVVTQERLADRLSKVEMANYRVRTSTEAAAAAEAKRGAAVRGSLAGIGKTAAGVAGLTLATTGLADHMGLANTATLALTGSFAGPWGAAAGAAAGLFLDLKAAGDGFTQTLRGLDAASDSGSLDKINEQLAKAKAQLKDINSTSSVGDFFSDIGKTKGVSALAAITGGSVSSDDAQKSLAKAQDAKNLLSLAAAQRAQGAALQLSARGYQLTAAGARAAAESAGQFNAELAAMNQLLSNRASRRDFEASLDDFTSGLKENGKTLDINTAKGRANQANLDNIASTALKVASNMKLGSAGQSAFLQRARDGFVRAATAAGMTEAAARRLANRLVSIDRLKALPKVGIDGLPRALGDLRVFQGTIDRLHGKKVTVSITKKVGVGADASGALGVGTRTPAAGGLMRAMFPGETTGPRDDSIPAMLSHREFVQPVASVDWYGERFMEDVRTRRLAKPQGYADGGQALHFADGGSARKKKSSGGGKKKATKKVKLSKPVRKKLNDELNDYNKALAKSTDAIQKETSVRDDLIAQRNQLADTVSSAFKTDLFTTDTSTASSSTATSGSIWAAGAGSGAASAASPMSFADNLFGTLKSDTANANAFKALIVSLKKRGVSGGALQAIEEKGDLGQAQSLAGLSNKELAQYETLYNQREAATNSVGVTAGNQVFGKAIAAEQAVLNQSLLEQKKQTAAVNLLTKALQGNPAAVAQAVSKGVNKTAAAVKAQHKKKGGK